MQTVKSRCSLSALLLLCIFTFVCGAGLPRSGEVRTVPESTGDQQPYGSASGRGNPTGLRIVLDRFKLLMSVTARRRPAMLPVVFTAYICHMSMDSPVNSIRARYEVVAPGLRRLLSGYARDDFGKTSDYKAPVKVEDVDERQEAWIVDNTGNHHSDLVLESGVVGTSRSEHLHGSISPEYSSTSGIPQAQTGSSRGIGEPVYRLTGSPKSSGPPQD